MKKTKTRTEIRTRTFSLRDDEDVCDEILDPLPSPRPQLIFQRVQLCLLLLSEKKMDKEFDEDNNFKDTEEEKEEAKTGNLGDFLVVQTHAYTIKHTHKDYLLAVECGEKRRILATFFRYANTRRQTHAHTCTDSGTHKHRLLSSRGVREKAANLGDFLVSYTDTDTNTHTLIH